MDRPQKRMSNKKFAGIAAVAILVPCIVVIAFYSEPFTWGASGTLTISMALDKTEMNVKESINATVILKNSGSERLRVLQYFSDAGFNVYLVDENGNEVRYLRPPYMTMKRGPTDYNSYMTVLEPGATLKSTTLIRNMTHSWDIQANHTYQVMGEYYSEPISQSGVMPHWTGTVKAEPITIYVKP